MMKPTQVHTSRFWKRFRKNKAALVASACIVVMVFVAIFAYPLATDSTPDANTMIIEIGTKAPGYRCLLLKKYSPLPAPTQNAFTSFFMGREQSIEWLPIQSALFTQDSVFVQHIMDETVTEPLAFSLKQLAGHEKITGTPQSFFTESRTFWLGTDRFGRDVYSRLLIGTRVSLAVGFIAVILSIFIGVLLGALSGYFGGWIDQGITWLINVIWAIPTLLLVFAITFALGKGFWQIFIAVGLTMWVGTARLIRGQVMALKELEFIQAAKTMGFSSWRIITRHILPNVMGPTIVMAASNFATAILIEAGLSFLGIGVQPPASSWGLMIKENYNFIITNRPLLAIIPGIAIMMIVLAFNILGNGLRDALDVKTKI